jgi:KUP system potassium uptake protein
MTSQRCTIRRKMVESKGNSPEEGERRSRGRAVVDVPPPPLPSHGAKTDKPTGKYLAALSLATLGVVYGDIGTSPLYAFKECFHGAHAVAASPGNILGVLSLIFWALVIVICIKYLVFILRADNRGEGGIIALMSLVVPSARTEGKRRSGLLVVIGLSARRFCTATE